MIIQDLNWASLSWQMQLLVSGGGGGGGGRGLAIFHAWGRGVYSVQNTLRACAANMGSKISLLLLVYKWPLIKCIIWYMNGTIFQNSPKFEPKFVQIKENFGKIKWFSSYFGPKMGHLVYEWTTFSWKIGICIGLLSNFAATHSYQNQTWEPPRDLNP